MVTIEVNREIRAPLESIWKIVSEVDRDSEYWKGISSIKNIRREENLIERTVKVGFMGNEGYQIIKLNPMNSIELTMTKGPLKGSRVTKLVSSDHSSTRANIVWNFTFSRVPIFAHSFIKSQITEATNEALDKIAKRAEVSEQESAQDVN